MKIILNQIKMYFHQLRLLLWKNYIIKKRSLLVFLFELTVPLVLFLIMALIRLKQQAKPVEMTYFNAWPLPSAGFIPIMQGFCNSKNGIRNKEGFLEYPNSTAKEMLQKIDKIINSNWSADLFEHQSVPNKLNPFFQRILDFKDPIKEDNLRSNRSMDKNDSQETSTFFDPITDNPAQMEFAQIQEILTDLASLSIHLPHNLCKTKNSDDIMADGDRQKKHRPESIISQTTGNFDNDSNKKLTKSLAKNSGFIGLWMNMQKTFCGVDVNADHFNNSSSSSNQNETHTEKSDQLSRLGLSKNQLQSVSLLFHVIYSNPVILYSPNTSTIRDNLIKKANGTFELIALVNQFSVQWLNVSAHIIDYVKHQNETNLKPINDPTQGSNIAANITEQIGRNNSTVQDLLDKIDIIDSAACSWLTLMSSINLDIFKGFNNETDLVEYFLHRAFYDNVTVIASLVFDVKNQSAPTLDPHLTYKIRQNASFTYTTKKIRERYWYPSPRDWDYYYYIFGFTWLQDLIERAFIDYHSNSTILEPGTYFNQMPYPCYMIDNFLQMIQHVMPLCLTISFVYTVAMLSQTIVIEKELRLKEVMKIMGLNNSVHMLAWFITYFIQFSLIMLIVTCLLHFGKILSHSNPFVIFFMLEIFAIATICFSFLVSSLYSKAKLAAACTGILYFLSYVPCIYISIREDVAIEIIPWWPKALASLFSTSAFGIASKYIAFYENDGAGMQWNNMAESPLENDTFNCYTCVKLMIFDCFLYWIMAWYIENVNPSYGIPLPITYPFKPSYWLGNDWSKKKSKPTLIDIDDEPNFSKLFKSFTKPLRWLHEKLVYLITYRRLGVYLSHAEQQQSILIRDHLRQKLHKKLTKKNNNCLLEQEPLNLPVGVSIQNLTKVYDDSKLAVDDLSINFYESQITSFLGHNGAGKTTTMSLLTGLIPATSGHALIYNKDIRTDINEIRHNMGWCPQHNVLFEKLTVVEHLWFFAKLKQMNDGSMQDLIENLLRDTGLSKKKENLVDSLSGGMKRKLSVAIAFVGNANLVILDEPTAGVDPYARRAIWDLLLKYKQNRTIILSTHHMDEAELLGDRIAIISDGRLQCCGTALFLKNALGEGNHLTVVKDLNKIEQEIKTRLRENSDDNIENVQQARNNVTNQTKNTILQFIRRYIPSAYLKDETLREYQFIIPLIERCNPKFWTLFNDLERSHVDLKIESYGIHDVSLEEIFIKAAGLKLPKDKVESPKKGRRDEVLEVNTANEDTGISENENSTGSVNSSSSSNKKYSQVLYDLDYIYAELETGYRLYFKQFYATVVKRCLYNKRNWKSLLTQIVLPAGFICIAMTVALSAPGFFDLPELELSTAQFYPLVKKEGGLVLPFHYNTTRNENSITSNCSNLGQKAASSIEIVRTLRYIIGIGSACVLNQPIHSISEIMNNQNKFNIGFFGESNTCQKIFDKNSDIDWEYFGLSNRTKSHESKVSRKKVHASYYPNCICLKDMSGFECESRGTLRMPGQFRTATHEILLNISGTLNENDYYLYTTDMYRLKRYGGLSFDNEKHEFRNNCQSTSRSLDHHTNLNINHLPYIPESMKSRSLLQRFATNRIARVWYNNKGFHAMPTFLNVMNNALLRANVKAHLRRTQPAHISNIELDLAASQYGITVSNHPMNQTNNYLSTEYLLQGSDVLISIFTIVAMSFVNASFVLFLVYEQSIKSLHLQFLIGLNPFLYWVTNFIWDLFNYMLPASCVIIILKVFDVPAYVQGENYPAVISLFILYGWSVSPLMYPFTFVFKEPSNAYIFLIVINLFTGITCVESSFLFQVFSFDKDLKLIYEGLKTLFLIFPPYCLGRGLIDIAYNDYYNEFYTKTGQTNKIRSPFEWDIATQKLVVMACIGILAWLFTLLLEYEVFRFKWLLRILNQIRSVFNKTDTRTPSFNENTFTKRRIREDIDVNLERLRCENILDNRCSENETLVKSDRLILCGLQKIYAKKGGLSIERLIGFIVRCVRRWLSRSGATGYQKIGEKRDSNQFVAVDNLTFGVPDGECFGLLGVNGAGKTTTFKMLTTDLKPSDGKIFVNTTYTNIANTFYMNGLANKTKYWNNIGYCPQFDALYDELTPSDHIRLFARLKGIKSEYEVVLCQSLLERLDLLRYRDKPCGSLSLGNKRKLSTALSLVGNPSIVLLDEPTSGMDPMSRRRLWQEIINLTRMKNRSVLLTSHSMEECENLCTRLAIMVDGKFKCMGSVQHLKTKFGDGYTLTIKIKDREAGIHDEDLEEMIPLKSSRHKNKYINLILTELKKKVSAKCRLKERHFNNVFQFELPYPTLSTVEQFSEASILSTSGGGYNYNIGTIYRLIELNKLRFNIVDYSLSQNTLDNVFINFVKEHTNKKKTRVDGTQLDQDYDSSDLDIDSPATKKRSSVHVHFPIHDNDDQLLDLNDNNFIDLAEEAGRSGSGRIQNFNEFKCLDDSFDDGRSQKEISNYGFMMEQMEIIED